jgi:peptide/nickel transport system substrate-binding protein
LFKKLYFKLEILKHYFKKNLILILILISIGIFSSIFHQKIISFFQLKILQTKYIGISGLYTPSNLPLEIKNLISTGLTLNSEKNKPVISDIVQHYFTENNNQDYIFKIKDNIFWHDGKKLTTNDINYPLPGLQVTPIDHSTIKISTETPFAPFLAYLNEPLFKNKLVGIGQYKVNKIIYRDGYIKQLNLKPLDPSKEKIIYRFYPNDKDLITAYKLGEVDKITINLLTEEIKSWHQTEIKSSIETDKKYLALFINTEKIDNKQLRQAIAYATPKTKDKNERCISPISPSSWAYNPQIKEYDFDPERSKKLAEDNLIISEIKLSISSPDLLKKAEEIKKNWQEILNIKTNIVIENRINQDNYDVILSYGGIPIDPDQYHFWHSTQKETNLTKINNSRIDKLLEEGRQTFDLQKRKEIYFDFQKYLLEESPVVFLSYPTTYFISRVK